MASLITLCMAPDWRPMLTEVYRMLWRILTRKPVKHGALLPMAVLLLVLCMSALPGPAIAESAVDPSDPGGYRVITPTQTVVCYPQLMSHLAVVCSKSGTLKPIDQATGLRNARTFMVDKCYDVVGSRVSAKMGHDGLLMWWKKVHWGRLLKFFKLLFEAMSNILWWNCS